MKKHVKKIKKATETRKIPALLFAVIFAGLGAYILTVTHAASAATITLSATPTTVAYGDTFTVTVTVNSGTDDINVAEADLNYDPSKLQVVLTGAASDQTSNHSTSTLDSPINEPLDPADPSLVRVTSGDQTPGHGSQILGTVTFRAIGTNAAGPETSTSSTDINVRNTSKVYLQTPPSDGSSKQIFTTVGSTGASIKITPSAPTGLAASGTTATSTNLTWAASTDDKAVTGYDIYQGSNFLASTTSTSYNVIGLTPGTAYSFKVRAHDAVPNNSPFSSVVNVTTLADTIPPTAPSNPQVTWGATTADLSWTASIDNVAVTGYDIFQSNGTTKIATVTGTTYTYKVTGLTMNTNYTFKVSAHDGATPANNSAQVSFTGKTLADTTPPSKPILNNNPARTNTSVTLAWTASTDDVAVTRYEVYDGASLVASTTPPTVTYAISSLIPGTAHSYTVKAFDAAGNSAASDALAITLGIKDGDITGSTKVTVNGVDTYPPDNKIDGSDFSVVAFNWRKFDGVATRAQGDLTGDHRIESDDLSMLFTNWGK